MRNSKTLYLTGTFLTIYFLFLFADPQSYDWNNQFANFAPYLTSVLVGAIALTGKSIFSKARLRITLIDGLLIAFLLVCVTSNLLTNEYINTQTVTLSTCLIIYAILRSYQKWYSAYHMAIIIGIGLVIEIYILGTQIKNVAPQSWFLTSKGTLGNSGIFSCYTVTCFVFIFLLIENFLTRKKATLYKILLSILILLLLIIAQSRATIISLLLIIFCYLYRYHIRQYLTLKSKNLLFTGIGALLILLSTAAVCMYYLRPDSVTGRYFIYAITASQIPDHLLSGVGYGNFPIHYPVWQAEYFAHNQINIEQFVKVASITGESYNELLQLTVETGLPGITLISCLFYKVFTTKSIQGREKETTLLKLALLNILSFSFFSYPFHSPILLFITAILLALICNNAKEDKYSVTLPRKSTITAFSIAVVATICLGWHLSVQAITVRTWEQAKKNTTDYVFLDSTFNSLSKTLKNNGKFLKDYGELHFNNAAYEKAIPLLEQSRKHYMTETTCQMLGISYQSVGLFRKAEETFLFWTNMVPNRFTPRYFLLRLYIKEQKTDKAQQIAKEILTMPVKVPSSQVTVVQQEARRFLSGL